MTRATSRMLHNSATVAGLFTTHRHSQAGLLSCVAPAPQDGSFHHTTGCLLLVYTHLYSHSPATD